MKYKIGDTAWHACLSRVEVKETCPDCFGEKVLIVTLGNGEQVSIDCAGCYLGYGPPRGYITREEWQSCVEKFTVSAIHADTKSVDYVSTLYYCAEEQDLFDTEDEALARANEKMQEHNAKAAAEFAKKERDTHTWAWNVSYHRKCIRDAKKQIEYHTRKLDAAKQGKRLEED